MELNKELLKRYSSSLESDKHLWNYEIKCASVHLEELSLQGIISTQENAVCQNGLKTIQGEFEAGEFVFTEDEDIHSAVERRLIEITGAEGELLKIVRARNDLSPAGVRMWLKDEIKAIQVLLSDFGESLLNLSKQHIETIMPGFTHSQIAQPTTFAHYCLAHLGAVERNISLAKFIRNTVDMCPLGAAGMVGTKMPLDRHRMAKSLGFAGAIKNTWDAVSDRSHVTNTLWLCSSIANDLSRISEEFILFLSTPYQLIDFPSQLISSSKIMPHKKNPDLIEVLRGKAGAMLGNLVSMMGSMKGLPLGYAKDMQDDKRLLIDSISDIKDCLNIGLMLVNYIVVNKSQMHKLASELPTTSTDLAERVFMETPLTYVQSNRYVTGLVAGDLEQSLPAECADELRKLPDASDSTLTKNNFGSPGKVAVEESINHYTREKALWKS